MTTVLGWVVAALAAGALAVVVSIVRAGAPLAAPPGPAARLALYLTTNVAESTQGSPRPELRPAEHAVSPDAALAATRAVAAALGWAEVEVDSGPDRGATVRAVAITGWLRFRDDVEVRIVPLGSEGVQVLVRSRSRVGRGDLGANAGRVATFQRALAEQLARR
ncbi:MAG: DUF1499 domain-containing protein [Ectothiorhodospiraceae bacterium]|nr:DUF1499 domain-containing protein [Chromatiales bacterium]MCP5153838.1 DUF1499 domain-containing protein [Ectothiorhodospiraceae bacterium]